MAGKVDEAVGAALDLGDVGGQTVVDAVTGQARTPIKVFGEVVSYYEDMTPQKRIEYIQKGLASGQKFQELAAKEKHYAKLEALNEDFQKLQEGDVDAFRRLAAAQGIPGDYVEEAAKHVMAAFSDDDTEFEDEEEGDPVAEWENQRKTQAQEPKTVGYGDLDPEMRKLTFDLVKERTANMKREALDNDPIIGVYLQKASPKAQKAIRDMADELLKGRLAVTKGDFTKVPELLPDVVAKIRETVEAFPVERPTPPLGLGPAPGDGATGVHPDKAPDHVDSRVGAAAFGEYLNKAIAHEMVKGGS